MANQRNKEGEPFSLSSPWRAHNLFGRSFAYHGNGWRSFGEGTPVAHLLPQHHLFFTQLLFISFAPSLSLSLSLPCFSFKMDFLAFCDQPAPMTKLPHALVKGAQECRLVKVQLRRGQLVVVAAAAARGHTVAAQHCTVVSDHTYHYFKVPTCSSRPLCRNGTFCSWRKCLDRNGNTLLVDPSQTNPYFEKTISNPYLWKQWYIICLYLELFTKSHIFWDNL